MQHSFLILTQLEPNHICPQLPQLHLAYELNSFVHLTCFWYQNKYSHKSPERASALSYCYMCRKPKSVGPGGLGLAKIQICPALGPLDEKEMSFLFPFLKCSLWALGNWLFLHLSLAIGFGRSDPVLSLQSCELSHRA